MASIASRSFSNADFSFSATPNVATALTSNLILNTQRQFTLVTGTTTDIVRFPADFSLSLVGAWQWADVTLLPGDVLFNIGGPTTVRGYPSWCSATRHHRERARGRRSNLHGQSRSEPLSERPHARVPQGP